MEEKSLGSILLEHTVLTPEQLEEALVVQKEKGARLGEILVQLRFLRMDDILKSLSLQMGIPYVGQIETESIPSDLVRAIPINYAKKNELLPIRRDAEAISVAISDPVNHWALDDLRLIYGMPIRPVIASSTQIMDAINAVYNRETNQPEVMDNLNEENLDNMAQELEEVQDLLDASDEAPIIRLVNQLLFRAVKQKASDVHIEPFEKELVVRYRIDGILYDIMHPPRKAQNSILSRVKIMANLNIAEKRLPQDGRIRIKIAGKDIDIRVSTIPTSFGESVVMRLLDKSKVLLTLESIGFEGPNLKIVRHLIDQNHGIILVTGPTGSGKSTTLYACLSQINTPELKIITVEDPVEYQVPGINQIQVNPKIDLTFATSLRAILRQDPDVVMIGEMRDRETAEIAIQASLTGHLVLSTLHTNDAASSATRLVDMGVEPFLVSSSLLGIVAQRLCRTVCHNCAERYRPTQEEMAEAGISPQDLGDRYLYREVGCELCLSTGFAGRTGLHEIMLVDDPVRNMITKGEDAMKIKQYAIAQGMLTLRQAGIKKVLEGETTIAEILRVTQLDEM